MTSNDTKNDLATKLSFDQFSRQKIVSYLIDEAFRNKDDKKKFKIIDTGGHNGKTVEFQPKDIITILDVFDEKYEGYVKGDATKTDFKDNSFDIACSFDVLEHIPRDKRQAFIDEALRISNIGFFFTVPIDVEGKVFAAEVLLNNFHKNLFGSEHKWLKEHIDYRIPNEKEITQLVDKSGATQVSISNNQIGDWQLMQMLLFASSKIPTIVGEVSDINTWYNHNVLSVDSRIDVGYRKIFFISKNKDNVDSVGRAINELKLASNADNLITINSKTFREFSETFSLIIRKYSVLIEKYQNIDENKRELIDRAEVFKDKLDNSLSYNTKLTNEIDNMRGSIAWKITKPLRLFSRISGMLRSKRNKNL